GTLRQELKVQRTHTHSHSLTHSLTHTHSLMLSHTHSCTHTLIYSLTHSPSLSLSFFLSFFLSLMCVRELEFVCVRDNVCVCVCVCVCVEERQRWCRNELSHLGCRNLTPDSDCPQQLRSVWMHSHWSPLSFFLFLALSPLVPSFSLLLSLPLSLAFC